MDFTPVPGFPEETITFLRDLQKNNNLRWFEANREDYVRNYLDPAVEFVNNMGSRLLQSSPDIQYDSRTNGSGSILRIYRDVRFSADKSPYNTSLRVFFWEGNRKKMENPGYLLRISPDGINLYCGMYRFPKTFMEHFRKAVDADNTGRKLTNILSRIQSSEHYLIGGETYKRVPRGYTPDHKRGELLKYKGLHAETVGLPVSVVHSAQFGDTILEHFNQMLPLHKWLVRVGKPTV